MAEDNEINQMFAQEVLRRAGLDCQCVGNGEEAFEAARTGNSI